VTGAIAQLAPVLFTLTNGVLLLIIIGTVVRAVQGRLLPPQSLPSARPEGTPSPVTPA